MKKPLKEVNMSRKNAGEDDSEVSTSQTETYRGELGASPRLGRTSGTDTRDMSMTRGSKPSILDNARLCACQKVTVPNDKIH
jgi:hypothetical protein